MDTLNGDSNFGELFPLYDDLNIFLVNKKWEQWAFLEKKCNPPPLLVQDSNFVFQADHPGFPVDFTMTLWKFFHFLL